MRITKLEHSGIILEKAGERIVFDPVEFTQKLPEMSNVSAVIITHKHGDHLQPEILARISASNPDVCFFTTADAASAVPHAKVVRNADHVTVGSFHLTFFGRDHAPIIPSQVPCENIGVVVDDCIINPGDSFDLPIDLTKAKVLLVPSAAPWCKVYEAMQYITQLRPEVAIPVHDAVLSQLGNEINNNWLNMACTEARTKLAALKVGESLDVA